MVDNLILIVLYNKKIEDSTTVRNLLECKTLSNSKVVIWNNGPLSIPLNNINERFIDCGYQFEYIEELTNSSLAKVYNSVLRIPASKYIILDHDSTVNESYLKEVVIISSNEVGMPRIYSGNQLVNPCINMLPIVDVSSRLSGEVITTIGSGLVIGNAVASLMKDKFGEVFDERFILYGVDTTFCYRLHSLDKKATIKIINGFEHSLSRLESHNENLETLIFRKKERSCDLGLRIRFYSVGRIRELTSYLLSSCKRFLLRREQQYYFLNVLHCIIFGKHIRKH